MFNLYRKMFQFLLKISIFVGDGNSLLMGSTKSTKIEPLRNIMISQYIFPSAIRNKETLNLKALKLQMLNLTI